MVIGIYTTALSMKGEVGKYSITGWFMVIEKFKFGIESLHVTSPTL